MESDDLFDSNGTCATDVIEKTTPDERPGPMFVGPDRYFDEPEKPESRVGGMFAWAARAQLEQRKGILQFALWCNAAGDAEIRAVSVLVNTFQGRTPKGSIQETAKRAGVSRKTVERALARFDKYFPGVVKKERRREEVRVHG